MEQQYVESLKRLKFTGNINSVKTVLSSYVNHNIHNDVTDFSCAELNIPQWYDTATEKDTFDKFVKLLHAAYTGTVKRERFSPANTAPFSIEGNSIKLEFSWVLTQEQITAEVFRLLKMVSDSLCNAYNHLDLTTDEGKRKLKIYARLLRKVLVIKTFIKSGSVSYYYDEVDYDPLE